MSAADRDTSGAAGKKRGAAGKSSHGGAGKARSGTSGVSPAVEGERRLTAGERNAQLRRERQAAKRDQDKTGKTGRSGGAGKVGGVGTGGGGQSRDWGKPRGVRKPSAWGKDVDVTRDIDPAKAGSTGRAGDAKSAGAGDAKSARAGGRGLGGRVASRGRGKAVEGDAVAGAAAAGTVAARNAAVGVRAEGVGGEDVGRGARKPRHKRGADDGAAVSRTRDVKVHKHAAAARQEVSDEVYRAGFACFVGRPNAGKSTLTNAIVGQKIAITSNKPQTTRHVIRGVLHRENAQLVLVDTPGLHRPRTLLGERLNDLVRETWSEVDVIGVCFPADEPVGAGDRFISSEIAELKAKVIAVVTKVDLVDPATLAERLLAVSKLYDFAEIVPVSAVSGHQVESLADVLVRHLPESPPLYPDDVLTEEPEQVLIGELIREAALEGVRDELPHSIAVMVEEMFAEEKVTKIFADLYVERDSQKSIVIGIKGARLKDVGMRARAQIEELLGRKIYLDLHVRVAKEWQRDPKQLRKLGF
jgi:GTPase